MAGTSNINVQYLSQSGNQQINPGTVSIATPVGAIVAVTLASGLNTITVPAGATLMTIQPPASNTVGLILKGVTGDTGVHIHPSNMTGPIYFDANNYPATFVLTAASATTGLTYITFV